MRPMLQCIPLQSAHSPNRLYLLGSRPISVPSAVAPVAVGRTHPPNLRKTSELPPKQDKKAALCLTCFRPPVLPGSREELSEAPPVEQLSSSSSCRDRLARTPPPPLASPPQWPFSGGGSGGGGVSSERHCQVWKRGGAKTSGNFAA